MGEGGGATPSHVGGGGAELRSGAARSAGGDPKWSVSSRLAFPGVVIYRLHIKTVLSDRL